MKCGFCGREVERGVLECPYCHYRFEADAQVLSPSERDAFEGVTIEEDGSATNHGSRAEQDERSSERQSPRMQVKTFGCGSSMLLTLAILAGIVLLFFFLMPAFIVFAAIGAVVVFVLRLFM